jgi:hypothetical protein
MGASRLFFTILPVAFRFSIRLPVPLGEIVASLSPFKLGACGHRVLSDKLPDGANG